MKAPSTQIPLRISLQHAETGDELAAIDELTARLEISLEPNGGGVTVTITEAAVLAAFSEALDSARGQLATTAIAKANAECEHDATFHDRNQNTHQCLSCYAMRNADDEWPTPRVCGNHKPTQHRDGKLPWCNACGKH